MLSLSQPVHVWILTFHTDVLCISITEFLAKNLINDDDSVSSVCLGLVKKCVNESFDLTLALMLHSLALAKGCLALLLTCYLCAWHLGLLRSFYYHLFHYTLGFVPELLSCIKASLV